MMRRLLVTFGTFGLALTLVLLNGGVAPARPPLLPKAHTSTATASQLPGTSPLLPGESTFSSGAPVFDFGTNDTINFGTPNVDTLSSVQTDLKGGGLSLMRVWAYSSDSDATIKQKVQAATNAGMTCMFMLGQTDNLTWLEHVVSMVGSTCHIFEFGNEPDNYNSPAGRKITIYTSQWIADIPKLRALDPVAVFGGPILMWSDSNDGSQSTYPNDMAYFLATTAAAGVRANFIDYHDYPCTKSTSKAQCLSNTPGDFDWNWNEVINNEKTYYGKVIATGVSEYNFDPGTSNLYNWCNDGTFMTNWTVAAMDEIVKLGMSFANQFDSLNWGGYGCYDMFSDAAPYGPKPQFNAMVSEVKKYTSGLPATNVRYPSSGATVSGTTLADASASGATSVEFALLGGTYGFSPHVVCTAILSVWGWACAWGTTTVPNGTYALVSEATNSAGSTFSSGVTITVKN
jgi:hypothetical protein